ncbi:unnamed protein product [Closterium sp. NIES-54]
MAQPERFDDGSGRVWKQKQALYGLKKSPRQWYLKLREDLEEIGFTPSSADHSLFMLGEGELRSFIMVYMDDILIFSPSSDLVKVILKLQDKFKCKALGEMSFYFGLHIERDVEKRCMRVHQRKYLEALAANFGQSEGHVATPFPSGFKSVKGPEEESVGEEERRRFHSLVGSLMYAAVNTRPDVAFATGHLARDVQCPNEEQVAAGMRVAKYLGQTPTVGLQYSAAAQRRQKGADGVEPGCLFLTAFSDASYASEPDDITSVGGFICCVEPVKSRPVGPPHASAAVFPVARLGRVAIFILSRARVARDIFSARRAPRGTRRCPAHRAPRGTRRCPTRRAPRGTRWCPVRRALRGTRRCPKLPVACPVVRDGALSRHGSATGTRIGALSHRGSAPGARVGVLSHRGPAPGARGGAPASPAPALAAAAPAPPSAFPWSSRPRYCTRCSRLCLTPRLHSLQPPLTYPRRPSVAALRLSPRPPPPPSSPCSRGGEGMGVAGVGVMGGVLPFPSSSFRSHCCRCRWGGGCEGVGEPGEWHWSGWCETNQQPSLHLSSLPPSAAPAVPS